VLPARQHHPGRPGTTARPRLFKYGETLLFCPLPLPIIKINHTMAPKILTLVVVLGCMRDSWNAAPARPRSARTC
jgi:hypothetical protein